MAKVHNNVCLRFFGFKKFNQNLLFFATKESKLFLKRRAHRRPLFTPRSRLHLFLANIRLAWQKPNAVAEATNYVAVLTKADTEKEMELLCVGFAFVFANLRFVCYRINAMRFFTESIVCTLTTSITVGRDFSCLCMLSEICFLCFVN